MTLLYSSRNTWKTVLYSAIRIALGSYLFLHAITNIIDFEGFLQLSQQYFLERSDLSFLANFTPVVPLLEFFLSLMILTGLYTRISLIWAIVLGVFFTLLFHFTGDLETAIIHSYTVILKVGLFYCIYYNKFSADYYNIWTTLQVQEKRRKRREAILAKKRIMESLQGL